jgi:osmotically inducible lipoprotein OsmB
MILLNKDLRSVKNANCFVILRGITMKNFKSMMAILAMGVAVLGLTACGSMSARDQNTAIGAGVGAVGGAVLTGGSALGTVGGAAVGGVIGNQIDKKK